MRRIESLNNEWVFAKTDVVPEQFPEMWEHVTLPHTWNAQDGQDGGNDYYRGTCMYVRKLSRPEMEKKGRAYLEFQGAAMIAEVFLNGKRLAHHEGGYSTFRVDITEELEEENLLCVSVNNGVNDHVYPQKADFTFYGGLYRNVNIIVVSEKHFELLKNGTPGLKVTPKVNGSRAVIHIQSWQNGGSVQYTITGEDAYGKEVCVKKTVSVQDECAETELIIDPVHLWDGTEDPYLYELTAELIEDGKISDIIRTRFGCRTFSFDQEKGFFLNGRSYPLRGVSRHQDWAGAGNALSPEMHRKDMKLIREIGANTIRLAHYQQSQYFYDLCDEAGMVVWAEIPYITQHMPNGRENTISQMKELVTQCHHHPSIVCWGLSNEITASGNVTDDLMENHRLLNDLCHRMDTTRPTTMAHVFMLEKESPLIDIADIGSYNLYFGWYLGELEQNDSFFDQYHSQYPERIIGFSEYGADANPQYQSAAPERGDYTETYQCVYHEHILKCIEERPYLWATHVWNLFDFAADGRDEGGKNGVNQKGLVTMDRALKKDAFYLYKAYWNKEDAFVHVCGKRYVDRVDSMTEIKVYSNQKEVSLYVDGSITETKQGNYVFTFEIPLTGEHFIEARSKEAADTIYIRKVETENSEYCMLKKEEVVNWFDKDELDFTCFSIKDTMGAIMQNPASAAILNRIMEKARASRGDVAEATSGNANLQAMMAGLSLESILKQAGKAVSAEDIRNLNAALQKIKK